MSLTENLAAVRAVMVRSVRCRNSGIQACVDALLANPGKMLRPSLAILSWRAVQETEVGGVKVGPNGQELLETDQAVIRLAAAIELLHMATLVHDDVIDQAQTRRSQPSVFASHGPRTAVLVGDLLFAAAFQLVADQADRRFAETLAGAIRGISESEILQLNRADPRRPSYRQYLHQITGKTAILFAVSCRAGAELATADGLTIQNLQRGGYDLGLAFQIVDDILDFNPDATATGKTPGRDLELGLLTLPVLAALRQARLSATSDDSLATLLELGHFSAADLVRVRELVQSAGGFATARQWASRYTHRALREFSKLPESAARYQLIGLTRELLQRQY